MLACVDEALGNHDDEETFHKLYLHNVHDLGHAENVHLKKKENTKLKSRYLASIWNPKWCCIGLAGWAHSRWHVMEDRELKDHSSNSKPKIGK